MQLLFVPLRCDCYCFHDFTSHAIARCAISRGLAGKRYMSLTRNVRGVANCQDGDAGHRGRSHHGVLRSGTPDGPCRSEMPRMLSHPHRRWFVHHSGIWSTRQETACVKGAVGGLPRPSYCYSQGSVMGIRCMCGDRLKIRGDAEPNGFIVSGSPTQQAEMAKSRNGPFQLALDASVVRQTCVV